MFLCVLVSVTSFKLFMTKEMALLAVVFAYTGKQCFLLLWSWTLFFISRCINYDPAFRVGINVLQQCLRSLLGSCIIHTSHKFDWLERNLYWNRRNNRQERTEKDSEVFLNIHYRFECIIFETQVVCCLEFWASEQTSMVVILSFCSVFSFIWSAFTWLYSTFRQTVHFKTHMVPVTSLQQLRQSLSLRHLTCFN